MSQIIIVSIWHTTTVFYAFYIFFLFMIKKLQKKSSLNFHVPYRVRTASPKLHGHIGSNIYVKPKTFFLRGKSHHLAEIREC